LFGTKWHEVPSNYQAEKEIRLEQSSRNLARRAVSGCELTCGRAILLKFVRLAHNSVTIPTAEIGVREQANALKDNLVWH
jgi:hypothetical protein